MNNIKQLWDIVSQILRTQLTIPEIRITGYNCLTVLVCYLVWDNRHSMLFNGMLGFMSGVYQWFLNLF